VAVSLAAIRRLVVGSQGYAARFRRAGEDDVEAVIRRLTAVQLDSISTVDRAHRLTISSRVGAFPEEIVARLLLEGRVFEYWAHEASILPIELWPHFRHVMDGGGHWGTHDRALQQHSDLVEPMLERIRAEGPLASRDFEGQGDGGMGGMWNWKPAKMVLEALWNLGEVVVAGRVGGFQRLYDLPERVLPREVLDTPVPDQETQLRELVRRAVVARGALTDSGVANHWHMVHLHGGAARTKPVADELVAAGVLERLAVEDDGASVLVPAGAALDPPRPSAAVLLSPFDNLLWDRRFVHRVFGFDHVIEIYKRAPERRYGYYVLPFLWRDRIVGRADLKSDRAEGALTVNAFHLEPGVRRSAALDEAFSRALDRLRRTVGLERVVGG
jgi:uncharacterized protein YcaQ